MALSKQAKDALRIAVAQEKLSDEVIAELEKLEAAEAIEEIATPASATAEDVANKLNELLAALK